MRPPPPARCGLLLMHSDGAIHRDDPEGDPVPIGHAGDIDPDELGAGERADFHYLKDLFDDGQRSLMPWTYENGRN